MTRDELITLKAAVVADPAANALFVAGDMPTLTAYVNALTATDAWRESVPAVDLVAALRFATYDGLAAGKRDAFRLMLEYGPVDATKAAIRNGLGDMFATGGTYSDAQQLPKMMAACTEKATWAQTKFPFTTPAAVGGVTAIKRAFTSIVTIDEVSALAGV